jgi:phage tail sheath protein FI
MPEYLAPGVYVEETSFRSKSIEGVSTTTTGFIGPTRYGPIDITPDIVTSLVEFERTYGGREKLNFSDGEIDNYTWHAVRAFFEEGGKRLYVSRTFRPTNASNDPLAGFAHGTLGDSPPLIIRARFPGEFGNARVTFTLKIGQNVLVSDNNVNTLRSVTPLDVVLVRQLSSGSPATWTNHFCSVEWDAHNSAWTLEGSGAPALATLHPDNDEVRIIVVTVTVQPLTPGTTPFVAADLPLDPHHERAGSPDSLFAYFSANPASQTRARTIPIVIEDPGNLTGVDVLDGFVAAAAMGSPPSSPPLDIELENPASTDAQRSITVALQHGDDGERPTAGEYEGEEDPNTGFKRGLVQFEDLEDISIVAAPGSTFGYANGYRLEAQAIAGLLISHCQKMRYRIAVLDSGDALSISEVRAQRARLDSSYAALYYPWVRVLDPLTQRETNLPPSGFVAGIYARNDINRAVYKAPANEVVNLAIGFEQFLNKSQQEVLNPEGINCFRFFEGRGMRLWGARTISSDPEWKYVNLRRYFAYLERSIDKGTQWAVFEPNGEQLWANVRRTIETFLLNEWQNGALLGDKPEKAYFVKCDRSTMSQNDLDNGRLVCLIGVAPLRPAEFVIFRIGQWTADRKV